MEPNDYDIEAAYANDPVGTTNAVIAEAAATVAEELAAYTGSQQRLAETRIRLHAALAEAKSLRIQIQYLTADLIEARAEAKQYTESRIEAVV